jgi:hypothetical protein
MQHLFNIRNSKIFIFWLIGTLYSVAQVKDSTMLEQGEDYVYNSRKQITLSVVGFRYFNGLYYVAEKDLSYRPMIPIMLGIGFSHKLINVNVGLLGFDLERKRDKSNHNFQLQMSAFLSRYGLDFIYARNEGYYIGNQRPYELNNTPTDSTLLNNMLISRLSVNALIILSKKFNLRTTLGKNQITNRTLRGWFLNMSVASLSMRNKVGPIIPISLEPVLQNSFLLDHGMAYSLAVLPGYAIHKVWGGKFYASIAPCIGPSFQWIEMREFNSDLVVQSNISIKTVLRVSVGYHTQRWVFGASLLLDTERFYIGENTILLNNIGKLVLKVGYKIQVPKWAKKYSGTLDTVEDKLKQYEHNTFGN